MVQLASGQIIARLDADDVSHPRRFERQLQILADRPDVGLVACVCDVIGADGESVRGPDVWRLGAGPGSRLLRTGPRCSDGRCSTRSEGIESLALSGRTDFYPRLSRVADDPEAMSLVLNQQIHIGLVLAGSTAWRW